MQLQTNFSELTGVPLSKSTYRCFCRPCLQCNITWNKYVEAAYEQCLNLFMTHAVFNTMVVQAKQTLLLLQSALESRRFKIFCETVHTHHENLVRCCATRHGNIGSSARFVRRADVKNYWLRETGTLQFVNAYGKR